MVGSQSDLVTKLCQSVTPTYVFSRNICVHREQGIRVQLSALMDSTAANAHIRYISTDEYTRGLGPADNPYCMHGRCALKYPL